MNEFGISLLTPGQVNGPPSQSSQTIYLVWQDWCNLHIEHSLFYWWCIDHRAVWVLGWKYSRRTPSYDSIHSFRTGQWELPDLLRWPNTRKGGRGCSMDFQNGLPTPLPWFICSLVGTTRFYWLKTRGFLLWIPIVFKHKLGNSREEEVGWACGTGPGTWAKLLL